MLNRWAQIWTEPPPLSREVGKGPLVEVVGTEFRARPHKLGLILRFQIDTGKMVITVRISNVPLLWAVCAQPTRSNNHSGIAVEASSRLHKAPSSYGQEVFTIKRLIHLREPLQAKKEGAPISVDIPLVLSAKQIGVCAGTVQHECIALHPVDKQPVRGQVALLVPGPFAL